MLKWNSSILKDTLSKIRKLCNIMKTNITKFEELIEYGSSIDFNSEKNEEEKVLQPKMFPELSPSKLLTKCE